MIVVSYDLLRYRKMDFWPTMFLLAESLLASSLQGYTIQVLVLPQRLDFAAWTRGWRMRRRRWHWRLRWSHVVGHMCSVGQRW